MHYFFALQVFKPTNEYKGQKLTKLVNKNIPPKANNTYAKVPSMVPL